MKLPHKKHWYENIRKNREKSLSTNLKNKIFYITVCTENWAMNKEEAPYILLSRSCE